MLPKPDFVVDRYEQFERERRLAARLAILFFALSAAAAWALVKLVW